MSQETAGTGEIAPAHRFDVERLERYLQSAIPDFGAGLTVRQFQGGASNPTFLLQTDGGERRYVLRKKPPGTLLASAHQVDREFRVMSALAQTDVPVPRMRHLCEDPDVIGTAFYVMDFMAGRIFRDARLPGLSPQERAAIYDDLNATLAKLHAVDFEAAGLGDYGRHGGYFERQVSRWTKQYRGAQSEELPAMEALIAALPGRIPAKDETTIAHGDYRLENVMFAVDAPKLIAVLDWELSTLGHPLADLGYNAFLWRSHGESWGTLDGVDFASSGIPTEAEYVESYLRRTGREAIADWPFYVAFAIFRLASISQGVYRRVLSGAVASEREAVNGAGVLAEQALAILEGRE
ncbi:MAG TPA: phosphotransferase family protein [Caulobacteraceae bacterium]|nr:phosphotransferase family protein [Caulobacteraceae bacterium]